MRFSVWPSPARPWSEILELARHADATGWDGVYFADHFMPNTADGEPAPGDTLECWTVLSALAALTENVRLGPLVLGNTYRHPAVVANMAAAIDHVSGGRLVLGLGAGWQVNEHGAYGIDLYDVGTRMDRFEEACEVITGLLSDGRTTFAGEHYRLTDAPNEPHPVQSPMPILVGGGGEKRTMRIAARYADEWNTWGEPDHMRQKIGVLRQRLEEIDRDPATMRCSANALLFLSDDEDWLAGKRAAGIDRAIFGTPSQLSEVTAAYADAGVDEFIIPDFNLGRGARRLDTYDRFLAEVAAPFRDT